MVFWTSLLLALRSLALALLEAKSWPKKLFHGANSLGLLLCSFLLFRSTDTSFDPIFFMAASGIIGLFLVLRLYGFFRHSQILGFLKIAFFGSFYAISVTAIVFSGFLHLSEEKALARLIMTGKQTKKWVDWQNPEGPLTRAFVDAYEVILETPEGAKIGRYDIYGDLVAVRIQTLRLPFFLNFLGIPNSCRIDAVHNGYRNMHRHRILPHIGFTLPLGGSLFSLLWEKLFSLEFSCFWIKTATLESQYFPLVDTRQKPICENFSVKIPS